MDENGEQLPETPRWWKISVWWHPMLPGAEGLHEVMFPIVALLASFDDQDARTFVVVPQASERLRFGPFDQPS